MYCVVAALAASRCDRLCTSKLHAMMQTATREITVVALFTARLVPVPVPLPGTHCSRFAVEQHDKPSSVRKAHHQPSLAVKMHAKNSLATPTTFTVHHRSIARRDRRDFSLSAVVCRRYVATRAYHGYPDNSTVTSST